MTEVQCSCGYVAEGETPEELLDAVETHIDAAHGRRPSPEPTTEVEE